MVHWSNPSNRRTKISGTVLDPSDDKARSLISCSVEHPLCPHVKKKVRAIVSMSSTIFRPITVDGAEHTEIESVSPSGNAGCWDGSLCRFPPSHCRLCFPTHTGHPQRPARTDPAVSYQPVHY